MASPSNQQGITNKTVLPVNLKLNIDLIGAFQGNSVLLKGGNILHLGGKHFTDLRKGQVR